MNLPIPRECANLKLDGYVLACNLGSTPWRDEELI